MSAHAEPLRATTLYRRAADHIAFTGRSFLAAGGRNREGRLAFNNTPFARQRSLKMSFILWLIVGGIVGWLASLIMKTDGQQGILLNVIVGIVGAFIGGWLISPMVGTGTINDGFSIGSLVVSLIGAIILLAIVNLFRRGRVR
jgi:uncharacterized membrane protein YeaQ/YmgE (transglycosylase-associated protein family)